MQRNFIILLFLSFEQLHLGVESIRAPELIFQPSMVGSSEAGLTETIQFILNMFTADEQQRLVNNVFLTGAIARFPGGTSIVYII